MKFLLKRLIILFSIYTHLSSGRSFFFFFFGLILTVFTFLLFPPAVFGYPDPGPSFVLTLSMGITLFLSHNRLVFLWRFYCQIMQGSPLPHVHLRNKFMVGVYFFYPLCPTPSYARDPSLSLLAYEKGHSVFLLYSIFVNKRSSSLLGRRGRPEDVGGEFAWERWNISLKNIIRPPLV